MSLCDLWQGGAVNHLHQSWCSGGSYVEEWVIMQEHVSSKVDAIAHRKFKIFLVFIPATYFVSEVNEVSPSSDVKMLLVAATSDSNELLAHDEEVAAKRKQGLKYCSSLAVPDACILVLYTAFLYITY